MRSRCAQLLFSQGAPCTHGAHGVVASHPLRMRKALGSNPSVSIVSTRIARCLHMPSFWVQLEEGQGSAPAGMVLQIHASRPLPRPRKPCRSTWSKHPCLAPGCEYWVKQGVCGREVLKTLHQANSDHTRSRAWVVAATTRRPNH